MLIDRICHFDQPCTVFDQLEQFRRSKILNAVLRRIAQRLEQTRGNQNRHVMRLAIQNPSSMFRCQPGRNLSEYSQELILLLAHASSFTVRSIHEPQDGFAGGCNRFVFATVSRRLRLHRRSRSFTATSHAARKDALDSSSLKNSGNLIEAMTEPRLKTQFRPNHSFRASL